MREMLKSKIHRMTITESNENYIGSITIDRNAMEAADIMPYEKALVADITNGARFETYVIPGEACSGVCCVNGAAAHLVNVGDLVIVFSFTAMKEKKARRHRPTLVFVDEKNQPTEVTDGSTGVQ